MRKSIWLSYDLGVRGDYEGLYVWLANHDAVECGDSFAYFTTEIKGSNVASSVTTDLKESVKFAPRDRIYIIWRQGHTIKGRFILGRRKNPPWVEYRVRGLSKDEEA